jgi:glycine cleavage system aminomethyltransferase T
VAQQQTGQKYSQRSFEMDGTQKPADGTLIYGRINNEDVTIGQINCSSWSWGLEKMIGNVCLEFAYRDVEEASISIDDETVNIRLSRGPLRKFEQGRLTPAPIGG